MCSLHFVICSVVSSRKIGNENIMLWHFLSECFPPPDLHLMSMYIFVFVLILSIDSRWYYYVSAVVTKPVLIKSYLLSPSSLILVVPLCLGLACTNEMKLSPSFSNFNENYWSCFFISFCELMSARVADQVWKFWEFFSNL